MKLLALAVLALVTPAVSSSAEEHAIEDERGEVGSREPYVGFYYVTPPEGDLWWVDIRPTDEYLEVSWRVDDLEHRTFTPSWEGLNFLTSWGLLNLDGTYRAGQYVVAERAAARPNDFWLTFEFYDGTRFQETWGEFDWANDTVRVRVPIENFESGQRLYGPVAWSSVTTQNWAYVFTGIVDIGDRAPNQGLGNDVTIP